MSQLLPNQERMTGCISIEVFIPVSLMVQLPHTCPLSPAKNDVHPALWESTSHDGIGVGVVGVDRVCVSQMVNP
jgi:hypothetical protein